MLSKSLSDYQFGHQFGPDFGYLVYFQNLHFGLWLPLWGFEDDKANLSTFELAFRCHKNKWIKSF